VISEEIGRKGRSRGAGNMERKEGGKKVERP